MKINKKLFSAPVLIILGIALVSASIFTYLYMTTQSVTVQNSLSVNGQPVDSAVLLDSYSIFNGWEQKKSSNAYVITNVANRNLKVTLTTPSEEGITNSYDTIGLSTKWSSNENALADAVSNGDSVTLTANEHAVDWSDASEARITIDAKDVGIETLNDLNSISWDANVITGYLPHVDVFLENGETLVFEFAKTNPLSCDVTPYPTGILNTFGTNGIVDDNAYAWESNGPSGPCDDPTFEETHNSLAEWKSQFGNVEVLRFEIETDAWISNSQSTISNIVINGNSKIIQTLPSQLTITKDGGKQSFYVNSKFANNLVAGTYNIETTIA